MKVTKLTQSDKDPRRYTAEFEDGHRIPVTVALIADFSLYTGRELDDEAYDSLKAAALTDKVRSRALRILGSRSMSRQKIRDRLVEKGEREEIAEETADWLERIGAVNDEEYAARIVRHYAGRGYGEMRVRDELYRRGIPREFWETALVHMQDMEDTAYSVLCSKLGGKTPDAEELKRAADALYRRGFTWEDIKSAVNRYCEETKDY